MKTQKSNRTSIAQLLFRKKLLGVMGLVLLVSIVSIPRAAHAFSIGEFLKNIFKAAFFEESNAETDADNSDAPFPFLSPVANVDPRAKGTGELEIINGSALVAGSGPMGTSADVHDAVESYRITTYTVREGDNISVIAKTFGVTVSTIRWANDIPRSGTVRPGQVLVILPVSGVQHTVAKGDTVASIAKKYGGDPDDIYDFNGLAPGEGLVVGSTIVIPDGEVSVPVETTRPSQSSSKPTYVRGSGPEISGYFMRPIVGGRRTTGIHGYNGVDLANSCGTPVYASAAGTVITARSSGWNGGYGKFVVVAHPNGTQTLYAHLSVVDTSVGSEVAQGQEIGNVGTTGKSTGCHLHFEIRGAKNPF